MKKNTTIWLVTAVALILVGTVIFASVMTNLNWDFTKLSTVEYVTNTYEIEDDFSSIVIDSDVADIEFVLSEDKECKIECYEYKDTGNDVKVSDDTLTISTVDNRECYDHIGINLSQPKVTLYLPESEYKFLDIICFTGDVIIPSAFEFEDALVNLTTGDIKFSSSVKGILELSSTTGDITLSDVSANCVDLKVTTGYIKAANVSCNGEFIATSTTGSKTLKDVSCLNLISTASTGDTNLENVVASESFDITGTTGDVIFKNSDAEDIKASTTTGDIYGTLNSDKVFITDTSTGDVSVPNTTVGGSCQLSTSTGDIRITVENQ